MKTLFLYQDDFMSARFFELEGDYSHLHKVYINECFRDQLPNETNADYKKAQEAFEDKQDELHDLIFDDFEGQKPEIKFLDRPTKDWDHYIECGCYP